MTRVDFFQYLLKAGIVVGLVSMIFILGNILLPQKETIYGYYVRDQVRGDNLIAIRLPFTQHATGLVSVTAQHTLIGVDRQTSIALSNQDFAALLQLAAQWCQKPSVTTTQANQTPNYVLGVRCHGLAHQFELPQPALPPEIQQLLILAGHEAS